MTAVLRPIKIAVIGATGSVGGAVLDIISRFPERFEAVALAARSSSEKLLELASRFGAKYACLDSPSAEERASFSQLGTELLSGRSGLEDIAGMPGTDHVVFASSGTGAITALLRALSSGRDVSIANKESIAAAGPWVMPLASRPDQIRPLDSEHNAIWQCLSGEKSRPSRILLTASGGPFRNFTLGEMERVTPKDALAHPVWRMGAKITIDSASLMNKGIECIEAMQLFGMPHDRVGAVIHPGSLVHGIVFFMDGT
ncbi:MAG: 1-deoxy-D-xylulose-5-phosphate reductoisomerase, partial [Synergistaceae bacterium]|nr:1-deoxy-D-xylulose-5-phosphate reductoisomerase [Synergistaceae bacterium]